MIVLFNEFNNLALSGKVMVVALHLLGIVAVILWARFVSKRFRGGILVELFDRLTASSSKQKVEKSKRTTGRYYEYEGLEKPKEETIIWQYLLRPVSHIFKKVGLYYSSNNEGNKQGQHKPPIHTNRTIRRLKHYVNQNRAESLNPFLCSKTKAPARWPSLPCASRYHRQQILPP